MKNSNETSAADHTIAQVAELERKARNSRPPINRFADAITRWAGSGISVVFHLIWFSLWFVANANVVPGLAPFDTFPFNLLTMVVSIEAIFLTLCVLISQNRMSLDADKRAELDLQVNLLAEKEATMILRLLAQISQKLGVESEVQHDLQELLKETRVEELAKKLEQALPTS